MKTFYLLLCTALLATTGCANKSKTKLREQEAFLKGQQQALAAQQLAQQPAVTFSGLIRRPRVPWTEGLTLAQGLIAAQYTGTLDPTSIKILRQGQVYPVNIKSLLRGLEDPELEPGDIVEVTR